MINHFYCVHMQISMIHTFYIAAAVASAPAFNFSVCVLCVYSICSRCAGPKLYAEILIIHNSIHINATTDEGCILSTQT